MNGPAARVAILDDWQDVAMASAPWETLGAGVAIEVFRDHVTDEDALVERLTGFDVVVAMRERTPLRRALLERLPRLRLVVSTGPSNAAIDTAAARELGITVAATGYTNASTAELTWALVLAVTRNVCAEDRAVRAGGWQHTIGPQLAGATLGLVGLGNLGTRVARIAQAFAMRVIAWSRNLDPQHAVEAGVEPVAKEELFRRADVVSIHLVLSDRSRGLVGPAELALMRPTAYLINTSRGPIVDEQALVDALTERRIAGAGLDVYDQEPLPPAHPLRSLPNTVLTPHIGYVTHETYRRFYSDAVEDIAGFLRGEPVRVIN
jgi:phosphoglycerate dehydrogenase-like enzyme